MKPSLQLRVSQSLTMTPQLQQAIRLLQLSSIELQTEIQDALESNMMLEVAEEETGSDAQAQEGNGANKEEISKEVETETSSISKDDIPEDLPVDSEWDDIYDSTISYAAKPDSSEFNNFEIRIIRKKLCASIYSGNLT